MRCVLPLFVALVSLACGGGQARSPSQLLASDVTEVASLPPGYEEGRKLSASCSGRRGFRAIEDEALPSVDCSSERLSRVLRAEAAAQHARFIVDKSCRVQGRERVRVSCSARLAVPRGEVGLSAPLGSHDRPAPSPARVQDLDEPRPQDAAEILVSFEPDADARAARLPTRAYDRVAETAQPAVGRRQLGQVSARCPSCEDSALHHALRVTAGRLGAGEVSAVRCFGEAGGKRCVATALEPWSF
jgi:hypothetical protein